MAIVKDLLAALRDVSALQAKTKDLNDGILLLAGKVDKLVERLTTLEANHRHIRKSVRDEVMADVKSQLSDRITKLESDYEHLRESVKNEVLADIKGEILATQTRLDGLSSRVLEDDRQSS